MATEAEIRAAVAEADSVLAGGAQLRREMFPELARRGRQAAPASPLGREPAHAAHPRPVIPAAEADVTPEAVAGWSAGLGFQANPKQGRVTRAAD